MLSAELLDHPDGDLFQAGSDEAVRGASSEHRRSSPSGSKHLKCVPGADVINTFRVA